MKICYGIIELDQHWFRQLFVAWKHQSITWIKTDLPSVDYSMKYSKWQWLNLFKQGKSEGLSDWPSYLNGFKSSIFRPMWLWNLTDDHEKTLGHLFSTMSSSVHHFKAISEFKLELQSRNSQFGSKSAISGSCDLEIWWTTLNIDRAPFLCYFKLCALFHSHMYIQTGITVWKHPIRVKIDDFFVLCDIQIWHMTLKNNRTPLLSHIKLCTSFHHHKWIQTGVTVQKQLNWVLTSVTLTFDLWPWPFALTSLLSLVITPENFMMRGWWEHSQNGVTDGQTDGRTQTDGLHHS